jgi:hypothetical protein
MLIRLQIARRFISFAASFHATTFNVNRRATINKLLSRKIPRFKAKGRSQAGTASAHLWDRPFPKPKKIPPVSLLCGSKLPPGQPARN